MFPLYIKLSFSLSVEFISAPLALYHAMVMMPLATLALAPLKVPVAEIFTKLNLV